MDPKFDFLNSFVDISEEAYAKLLNISEYKKIRAETQIIKAEEVSSKVYLLVSGIIRSYLSSESGKEYNKNLYLASSFVASLTALIQKKPSLFAFETLTDCEVYEFDYYAFKTLCKQDLSINKLYSKVLEFLYMSYEKRLVQLISLGAKDRYLELQKEIPNVNGLIPQYHIASYLGITAVQLSRIRKKIEGN